MQEIWHCETPLSITTNTYSSGDNYKHISPYKFKRAVSREYPQYSGIEQQDAQEFMRLLISRLHEEMKIEISRKYSPFQFKLDETGRYVQQINVPYSRKYWRELNLAVGLQMAIAKKYWWILIWQFGTGSPYVYYMRVRNFGGF